MGQQQSWTQPVLKLPWPSGMRLFCSAAYGPMGGSPFHANEHNAFYALDFDKPWRGSRMPTVPILAAAEGSVAIVGECAEHILGYFVILNHGRGYQTLYAHLRDRPTVRGKIVQGQAIGYLGESGYSDGPHLHFQLLYRGSCQCEVVQSRPEPISGYRHIRVGRWYHSDNVPKGGVL